MRKKKKLPVTKKYNYEVIPEEASNQVVNYLENIRSKNHKNL